jgi:hypothetical protein
MKVSMHPKIQLNPEKLSSNKKRRESKPNLSSCTSNEINLANSRDEGEQQDFF